jgi:hypothetical protein
MQLNGTLQLSQIILIDDLQKRPALEWQGVSIMQKVIRYFFTSMVT